MLELVLYSYRRQNFTVPAPAFTLYTDQDESRHDSLVHELFGSN